MKIIAQTRNGFLAEFTVDDLAALVGETAWRHGKGAEKFHEAVGVDRRDSLIGASIDLAGRFSRVLEIERQHKALGEKAAHLRLLATALDALATHPLVPPQKKD